MRCFPSCENMKGNICVILPPAAWGWSVPKTDSVFTVLPGKPSLQTLVRKIRINASIRGHVEVLSLSYHRQVVYVHPERFRVIETDWHGLSLRIEWRQRNAVFRICLILKWILIDNKPVCPINGESLVFIVVVTTGEKDVTVLSMFLLETPLTCSTLYIYVKQKKLIAN